MGGVRIVRAGGGFDVVLHASNHSLDKGIEGISDTIGFWKKNYPEISFLGVHESADDAKRICVKRLGNIKIALLNFAEAMNFHMMPLGKPYIVDRMRKKDKKKIRAKIMRAREQADLVIVMPHWGIEYMYEPVGSQKEWARSFAEYGADLIIGTHPHVLEYTETIVTSDGRRVPCLYSLGNFISCQIIPGTTLGGMADITVSVENGKAVVSNAEIIPLITHTDENYSYFTTYFLSDYTEDMARHNRLLSVMQKQFGVERMTVEKFRALFENIMNRSASADAYFKTPADVKKYNIHGVLAAVSGKGSK